jgi:Rv2175c C-terminal domain of unknown function/DNA-binding protein Rv2175c, wHTH domain
VAVVTSPSAGSPFAGETTSVAGVAPGRITALLCRDQAVELTSWVTPIAAVNSSVLIEETVVVSGLSWWQQPPAWHRGAVSNSTPAAPSVVEPAEWLTLPDVADMLDLKITKVHQMLRERQLIAARKDGVLRIPTELVTNANVRKHLPGVLNLLHDAGYSDEEAFGWLYTEDESLPGTPATALGGPAATEVKRRAQALGF